MRAISTHFCLIEPSLISHKLLEGKTILKVDGAEEYASAGNIIFSQKAEKGSNGRYWSQTFRAVTKDGKVMRHNGCKIYVGIFLTDGSLMIIGTAAEIPILTVTPYENAYVAEVAFETSFPNKL